MTTIAWDGITLASDRGSWSGATIRSTRKIFRVKASDGSRFLVGFAGRQSWCLAVLAWMRGEAEKPNMRDYMEPSDFNNQCALVLDERLRIWQLDNYLVYCPMRERVYAMGGGQDFAWGALEAGATAAQAIRVAIKRSDCAAMGVDVLRFLPASGPARNRRA